MNLIVGNDAYVLAPYGWNPYFGSQTLGLVVPKAYLQYAFNKFTLLAGVLEASVGAESYNTTLDTNFSRSILDGFAEPGVLLGVRGTYKMNEKFNWLAGVNNGWSGIRDLGKPPNIEYAFSYFPIEKVSLTLQGLSGKQRFLNNVASGPTSWRNMVNAIGGYQVNPLLSLKMSVDYAMQSKALLSDLSLGQAVWRGVSAYVNYQFNYQWQGSLRGEIYNDRNGYTTGVPQNWREATVTLAYAPIKNILLRLETRQDFSNVNAFVNAGGNGVSNSQQSYALEGIYIL